MEEGIAHDNGIQKRVQLLNAANERHRLEGYYRLGQVPAHILHPLVKGLTKSVAMEVDASSGSDEEESAAMEVDTEAVVDGINVNTGCAIEMGKRGPGGTALPGKTQNSNLKELSKQLAYTRGERRVKLDSKLGREARANHPEDLASRNVKTRIKNKMSLEAFVATPPVDNVWPQRRGPRSKRFYASDLLKFFTVI